MTENKGDLISRSALKDATKKLYNETLDGIVKFGIEKVYDLISNAPTVEPNQLTQDIIDKVNVNIGLAQPIKDARPQGEWKLDDTEQFCYCDQCEDTYYPRPLDPSWNYCPHCGADMKGGAE